MDFMLLQLNVGHACLEGGHGIKVQWTPLSYGLGFHDFEPP